MDKKQREQLRENARRRLAGASKQAAAAKDVLDALDAVERQDDERVNQHLAELDAVARIVEAFQQVPMSESERLTVQVLLDNPGASSESLSQKARWKGRWPWHLHFGAMCRDRGHLLWPAPFEEKRQEDFYSGILANFDEEISTGVVSGNPSR